MPEIFEEAGRESAARTVSMSPAVSYPVTRDGMPIMKARSIASSLDLVLKTRLGHEHVTVSELRDHVTEKVRSLFQQSRRQKLCVFAFRSKLRSRINRKNHKIEFPQRRLFNRLFFCGCLAERVCLLAVMLFVSVVTFETGPALC